MASAIHSRIVPGGEVGVGCRVRVRDYLQGSLIAQNAN